MIINHNTTKTIIEAIAELIGKQVDNVAAYKKVKSDLASDKMYTEDYKAKKLEESWQIYLKQLEETKAAIAEKLEKIQSLESENEKIIELDDAELAGALTLVETTKGKLSEGAMLGIAKTLAGKYLALDTVAKAIENYGGEISKEFAKYSIKAEDTIFVLSKETENLEQSPDTAELALKKLLDNVLEYGEKLGLSFGGVVEDISKKLEGPSEDAKEKQLRKAMGLE
ncbi:MAG: hypothetical protein IKB60_01800 [Clostridia bacterium]|nr:hypothetical protein [Clostridia bacterium]